MDRIEEYIFVREDEHGNITDRIAVRAENAHEAREQLQAQLVCVGFTTEEGETREFDADPTTSESNLRFSKP